MKNLGLNEIREKYLSFFESKGHLRLKSFPLVPQGDKSLLLINAGMAPLKPYFTGKEVPPRKRVTTCQKCIRTPDIERVGKTARHGTFFEMLGNFSFGDYFKHEATAWAWEFITKELEIPTDKLWVTIYEDDDEAFEIWTKEVGVPADRIVRLGKEDNFWEIGQGPCGPCSEIHYDRGEEFGCGKPDCAIGCDCDRYLEFWNLVFTQFDKDEDGNYNRLANPNIDTGMGLERIAAIMQGVNNLFEVDTITNIMKEISRVAGVNYGEDEKKDISLRVITDHIRSTTFMISDNISPSNEGRGYVLRRLLRRAARHGKLLGIEKPFLFEICDTVIKESGEAYPELISKKDYIKKIIKTEEERFDETIDTGLSMLSEYIDALKKENGKVLDGGIAFKLYDTYGFPIDLTVEILEENGLSVDIDKFNEEMNAQKERARAGRNVGDDAGWSEDVFTTMDKSITTEFIGYDNTECEGKIIALVSKGVICDSVSDGDDAVIITDKTVFYGESGGQTGDKGVIYGDGFKAEVYDCKKLADGKILHCVAITEGTVSNGDVCKLEIDKTLRLATQRNHSATHLLQKALQMVLGDHIQQAGSFVTPERLRFDFSHFEAVTPEQLKKVENIVNDAVFDSLDVMKAFMKQDEAKKLGAMALFGEKYGDIVRVVKMGEFSTEFCGGCHVDNTSQIGSFKIISESSAAAGVRRIEAVTGKNVLHYLASIEKIVTTAAELLKGTPAEIENKIKANLENYKNAQKTISEINSKLASGMLDEIIANAKEIGDVKVICAEFDNMGVDDMRNMGDKIRDKFPCSFVCFASRGEDKVTFITMATKDAIAKGVHAGKIIKEVAAVAGGGGGGRPDSAQAGGKDVSKTAEALAIVEGLIADSAK